MPVIKASLLVALGLVARVAAHGYLVKIESGGKSCPAYNPYAFSQATMPTCGFRDHDILKTAFVTPDKFTNPDIICHVGATPGTESLEVVAGDDIHLQWSPWPESHKGPVLDYLANCNGDCTKVDKTKLTFNKIAEVGQISVGTTDSDAGFWGADQLRENDNRHTVTIPSSIAPGGYILRHEILALMGASKLNQAQAYPNCVLLKVTGYGTDPLPGGTLGTSLYTPTDPGIKVLIYGTKLKYQIPGPPLYVPGSGSGVIISQSGATPVGSTSAGSAASVTSPVLSGALGSNSSTAAAVTSTSTC